MKNPWSDRWQFVKQYIPANVSVIDFGCGNREALDHISPSKYLGIDKLESADLIVDLDKNLDIDLKFDIALLLGVLEYVQDPAVTLANIAPTSDHFIVLSLVVKQAKPEWRRVFTEQTIDELLRKYFSDVKHHKHGRYILSVCKK